MGMRTKNGYMDILKADEGLKGYIIPNWSGQSRRWSTCREEVMRARRDEDTSRVQALFKICTSRSWTTSHCPTYLQY